MNEQELNKKLAEWARIPNGDCPGCGRSIELTQSLDACFEQLVPKLEDIAYEIRFVFPVEGEFSWSCCLITTGSALGRRAKGDAETPALALCKAIEKLIDKKKR